MVSSQVCNASIPELVKTTHGLDKLLSAESTDPWGGGGALRTSVGKHVRPKSK